MVRGAALSWIILHTSSHTHTRIPNMHSQVFIIITVKETTKQKHKTSVCFTVVWLRGIESVRRVEVN